MADEFRKNLDKKCGGVGGVKCDCCNDFKDKDKPKLDRIVRRTMKHDLNKTVVDILREHNGIFEG